MRPPAPLPRAARSALLVALVLAGCEGRRDPASGSAGGAAVARARRLLAEAGYPEGRSFPKLEVLYNTDEAHKKVAAALQQMWRKNLGIEVELRNVEWKVYLDRLSDLGYQIARRGWIADYRDPNTFLEMFTSTSGNNNTGWSDPEYDRLIAQAAAEPDRARRAAILARAEKILLREAPVVPLYFYVSQNCWKNNVRGLHENVQDIHPLAEVWAEGRDPLVIHNGSEVQTLDPTLARGVLEHRVLIGLFEGLTTPDPRTLEPRPGVAERWEISPDGRKYTFHLREAAWTDGRPVTAEDFVYAWRRALDPTTLTDYAHVLFVVKGAQAYHEKKTSDPATIGVRAGGPRTLEVELEHPCPYFLDLAGFMTFYPVRRDVIERHGQAWTRPENIVTNGPFRLVEWKPTDSLTLEKNPRYWNAAAVRQRRLKFLPIEDRGTAWNLYKEGTLDWITALPLDQIEEIMKRPDYRGGDYLGTYFYSFNVRHGPLRDVRVRRALALAVDREALVRHVLRQGQKPAYHFVPPAWADYASPRLDAED
jgi:oligopeptide transport system substrate-binding protein